MAKAGQFVRSTFSTNAIEDRFRFVRISRLYALALKNDQLARNYLKKSLQFDLNNKGYLGQLANSYLTAKPIDTIGFWYAARLVKLTELDYDQYPYFEHKYCAYHGSYEGWTELVAETIVQTEPPKGFRVTPGKNSVDCSKIHAKK